VSFVNGVSTILGGKHVDYVLNQITKKASDLINKRNKDANVKPARKDKLFLILKSTIPNPVFNGQTKEILDMPVTKFQRKIEVSVRGRPRKEHRHLQVPPNRNTKRRRTS
jgi:DNA topoisomerase-2